MTCIDIIATWKRSTPCRGLRKVLGCQVLRLKTKRGTTVVAAYIACKGQSETLLVSHGNAVDLGLMLPFYK